MTDFAFSQLSHEKLRQLLAAVDAKGADDTHAAIEAADYNWRQCQYFGLAQVARLTDFARQVAQAGCEVFSRLFCRDYEVFVVSASQHFVKDLYDPQADSTDYAVAFGAAANDSFGLMQMDRPAALAWTGRLLGSSEDEADRTLSALEESLLVDLAAGLVKAVSSAYQPAKLSARAQAVCGTWPVEWDGSEAVFKITLEATPVDAGQGRRVSLLVACRHLEAVAGQDAAPSSALSPQQVKETMLGYIYDLPVAMTARLGTVKVDLSAVLGMEVDDILVLDKKVTDSVELLIDGKPFRRGRPVQSKGRYAVAIL